MVGQGPPYVEQISLPESRRTFPEDKKAVLERKIALPESKNTLPESLFSLREGQISLQERKLAPSKQLFCLPLMKFSSTECLFCIPEGKKALVDLACGGAFVGATSVAKQGGVLWVQGNALAPTMLCSPRPVAADVIRKPPQEITELLAHRFVLQFALLVEHLARELGGG